MRWPRPATAAETTREDAAGAILYAAEKATRMALDAIQLPRRQRLHQRLSDRAPAARRQALRDRRRHQRNPPHADRARAVQQAARAMPRIAMLLSNHRQRVAGLRAQRRGDAARWSRTCATSSPRRRAAAATRRGHATPSAASCWCATASQRCSIPARPFLELSPLAAHGMYDGDVAVGRHRHRHRPGQRARLRDRRQRRHRQGRHLLSRDREEAPARAGDRAREPPAVHLSGRFRRRVPAAAGRDLPRPRALRPHLLQPGADVGGAAFRRSRRCWAPAPPAAPMCRRCRTRR